jgi:undecaprenyl-diphosphatase
MSFADAILLGVVQGLTEFLPVSSSAHLVFAQHFLPGFRQPGILFDVLLHLGTLGAVLIYFRRDLLWVARGFLMPGVGDGGEARRLGWLILAATVPTGIIGLAFQDFFESLFTQIQPVAMSLLVTGGLLLLAERRQGDGRGIGDMRVPDALIIGVMQGVAIIPGISRSGSTIAAGLFRGLDRGLAARFSFLLSIPAILGAAVVQGRHVAFVPPEDVLPYLAGALAALIVAYLTIGWLIRLVQERHLRYFAYYCWVLGLAVLAYTQFP